MFCGKCGAHIPEGCEFCMECGEKVLHNEVDNKSSKKKRKKIWIVIPIVVVIIAIIVTSFFVIKNLQEKNGYFENVAWGTSMEEARNKIEKSFNCETNETKDGDGFVARLENYEGLENASSFLIAKCDGNDTLVEVTLMVAAGDDSDYKDYEIRDIFKKKYERIFGKPNESTTYSYKWETENSTIKIVSISEDSIMITYEK